MNEAQTDKIVMNGQSGTNLLLQSTKLLERAYRQTEGNDTPSTETSDNKDYSPSLPSQVQASLPNGI